MAEILEINTIERAAARQIEIAKKVRELTTLIEQVFPGYGVYIERRQHRQKNKAIAVTKGGDLANLPLLEQVETVLREATRPLQKQNLLKKIYRRGGNVSENTLSIYLSRYPQFISRGHGKWSIKRGKNGSEDS